MGNLDGDTIILMRRNRKRERIIRARWFSSRSGITMKSEPKQAPQRKPYRTPALQVYGDLARITNAVGNMGNSDGGSGKTMSSLA
jgi:hypothetical protein